MITQRDIADLCRDIYHPYLVPWTKFVKSDPATHGWIIEDGKLIVVFQGTDDIEKLLSDAAGVVPFEHPTLGTISTGFYLSLTGICEAVNKAVGTMPIILAGHSLGAAHAAYVAAELVAKDRVPSALLLWGCPMLSVGTTMSNLIAKIPLVVSRANKVGDERDPVTIIPEPPFGHPFATTIVSIGPPHIWDLANPLQLHSMQRYAEATPVTLLT